MLGAHAVHIELKRWVVHQLLHVNVNGTGNMAQLICDLLRDEIILIVVRSIQLNINRRGQTEIENLADYVGRLEEKFHAGKLSRQGAAQELGIFVGRLVPL